MNKEQLISALSRLIGEEHVLPDEPMSGHTSFRIGGPADFFLEPKQKAQLAGLLRLLEEERIPYFIMGNGSNLLVADEGYRGAVIRIGKNMGHAEVRGDLITAECGALLSGISALASANSLTGFEFAGGIPGTLGGACVMNAGAYGGEMKQVLREVTVLDEKREIRVLKNEELELAYRSSIFMRTPLIALEAKIQLAHGDREAIEGLCADLRERRQSKQPLDLPSAGSTFKRPEGYFAGKLIMDAGLRGYRVGGAMVSEKHCGFIVNAGGATARDVRELISAVQARVFELYGVALETEIRMLGVEP